MSALELSSDLGLIAACVLAANFLMGLLLGIKYNPWKRWPHKRINYSRIHNWTGYTALVIVGLHLVTLWASKDANFSLLNVLWPITAPRQPWINMLGAAAFYVLVVVVVTSYFRPKMDHRKWKTIHFGAYGVAVLGFIHGIWSDQTLKGKSIDYLDAEKVTIEACLVIVTVAVFFRVRHELRRRAQHRRA